MDSIKVTKGVSWVSLGVGALSIATLSGVVMATTAKSSFTKLMSYFSSDPAYLWCDIHEIMSHNEYSLKVPIGLIEYVSSCSFGSNSPNEDATANAIYSNPDGEIRYMFAVFDGHSTHHAAHFAAHELFGFVDRRMKMMQTLSEETLTSEEAKEVCRSGYFGVRLTDKQYRQKRPEVIKAVLSTAFRDADQHFLCESICNHLTGKLSFEKCIAGTCAIMAFVDHETLYIANTGDCRAVLCTGTDDNISFVALSTDHNTENPSEIARLQRAHPDDNATIFNSRVKGILRPTRHIGGALLKSSFTQSFVKPGFLPENWSPPYTTSQPEITVHPINTKTDRFVILASDGLWDLVSNEEACKFVLEYQSSEESYLTEGIDVSTYVVERALAKASKSWHHSQLGAEQQDESQWNAIEPKKVSEMISLSDKVRRNYYDDLSVTVFFFSKNTPSLKGHLKGPDYGRPVQPRSVSTLCKLKETTRLLLSNWLKSHFDSEKAPQLEWPTLDDHWIYYPDGDPGIDWSASAIPCPNTRELFELMGISL